MTSNPSPAIERQLREAWARKEWEFRHARWDYIRFGSITTISQSQTFTPIDCCVKDVGVPGNWRYLCKPPLDDEGDE